MPTCNNCGANVPLRKSFAGRTLEKQDRDCPECGEPLGPGDESRTILEK
jgi:hypothetical protein